MGSTLQPAAPVIPDHEILEAIGHGSYGQVWRARNVMGAPRAVKVVRRADFDSDEPFEREFDAVRCYERVSRQAEGLVDVLHVGRSADGRFFYYVMELADPASESGTYTPLTLRRVLADRDRLPLDECLAVAIPLALGLESLHTAGLLHQDVKPSNIIFVHGRAVLADIGLLGEIGTTGCMFGTEGYAPPEGSGQPSADLFALGIVLYECLTGEHHSHFPTVPKEWLASDGKWAGEFEFLDLVMKACEGLPGRRYSSAAGMLADLTILRSGQSLRRVGRLERRVRFFRRWILAMAVFAILSTSISWMVHQEVTKTDSARAQAELRLALGMEQSTRPDARQQALRAIDQAISLNPGLAGDTTLIESLTASLAMPDFSRETRWKPVVGVNPVVSQSLDICVDYHDGAVWWGAVGQPLTERQRLNCGERPDFASLSADGQRLAIENPPGALEIWARGDLSSIANFPIPGGVTAFCLDRTGIRIATLGGDGNVRVRNLEDGREWVQPIIGTPRVGQPLKISPNGRKVATPSGGGIGIFTNVSVEEVPFPGTCMSVEWDRHGEMLAAGGSPADVYVWDLGEVGAAAPARMPWLLRGHSAQVVRVAFHPSSGILASSSWDGTTRIWNLGTARTLALLPGAGGLLKFSTDGTRMARWDDARLEVAVSEYAASPICKVAAVLPRDPGLWNFGAGRELVVSRDGRLAAVPDGSGFRLFDAATAEWLGRFDVGHPVSSVAFAPDGSSVLAGGNGRVDRCQLGGNRATQMIIERSPGAYGELISVSRNGRWLAMPDRDGVVVCDLATDPVTLRSVPVAGSISTLEISPDGSRILVMRPPGEAQIIDSSGGEILTHLRLGSAWLRGAWSPDGSRVALCGDGRVALWDVSQSPALQNWAVDSEQGRLATRIAFSGDGRQIATALEPGVVWFLDTATGERLSALRHPGGEAISGLSLSDDCSRLVTTRGGVAIWFWDLDSWQKILEKKTIRARTPGRETSKD